MKICPVCGMHLADNIQSCFICGHSLYNCKTQTEEYNFHSMTSCEFEEKRFQYLMHRERYVPPVSPPPQPPAHKAPSTNVHHSKPVGGEMVILSLCALICSAIFFLIYLSTANDFMMLAVALFVIVAIICYIKAQL